jgi:predicted aminopeptidase
VLPLAAAAFAVTASACSPLYVVRAGIAEAKILRARRPIPEVILDPTTDGDTRGKLSFVVEARRFAQAELGIDVGDAYTMYTKLDRDTLALVVSAAYKDRLVPKTWWFPIVGHVPYRGFFSEEAALQHLRAPHVGL